MEAVPGDQSFGAYVAHRRTQLVGFAYVLSGDIHLAEDLVADVFATALPRWEQIRAYEHPDAYIHRMITNRFLSWRRKYGRVVVSNDVGELDSTVDDESDGISDRDLVRRGLRALSPRQRAVVVLRFYLGMSLVEVADALGCRPVTARAHLSRALATLRIHVGPDALER